MCAELRPRLCVIQRGSNGYGFNLHSERARPGQYIRAVDEDSPAERAGLLAKDRIVQVLNKNTDCETMQGINSVRCEKRDIYENYCCSAEMIFLFGSSLNRMLNLGVM